MHFQAQIKRGSTIDRMWRHHNRLGGEVSGVLFSTTNLASQPYIATHHLHADAITKMLDNPNIELIATGIALPVSAPADADSVGNEDLDAELKTKLQPAPIEPEAVETKEEEPAQENVAEEVTDETKEPTQESFVSTQENVVELVQEETKEPDAQENVVEESKVETFQPRNTGRRGRK